MIGRFVDVTATVLAGLAIGWLISGTDKDVPNLTPMQKFDSGAATKLPAVRPPKNTLTDSDQVRCAENRPYNEKASARAAGPLPAVYREMIGPLDEPTFASRAYDRYVAFTHEVRDEPWAAALEAGISRWSIGKDQQAELVIDYIQCRSHSCIVAGPSLKGNTASLGDLRSQGWWQAEGGGMLNVKSARDGSADFLFIVGRYSDED